MSRGDEMVFPVSTLAMGDEFTSGLTKREYLAAMAMQGWLASWTERISFTEANHKNVAAGAVLMADALLAELDKGNEETKL